MTTQTLDDLLDEFETCAYQSCFSMCDELRVKIKEALAQPEQEPVARMLVKDGIGWIEWKNPIRLPDGLHNLYTTPPQRTWVGLTPDEIRGISLASGESLFSAIMFTHDKLKEKNT